MSNVRLGWIPFVLGCAVLLAACYESPLDGNPAKVPSNPLPTYRDTSYTDFAPLRVGNEWRYYKSHYGHAVCDYQSWTTESRLTVTVMSHAQRGDTSIFRFVVRDSTLRIAGSPSGAQSASVKQDSVLETDSGIVATGRFPFFESHVKADSALPLRYVLNAVTLRAYSDSGSSYTGDAIWYDSQGWKKTFVQDKGLTHYLYSEYYHGWNGNELCREAEDNYSLEDFTAGPPSP